MYGKVCVKQSRVLYLVKFLNLCFQFEFHKDVLFQEWEFLRIFLLRLLPWRLKFHSNLSFHKLYDWLCWECMKHIPYNILDNLLICMFVQGWQVSMFSRDLVLLFAYVLSHPILWIIILLVFVLFWVFIPPASTFKPTSLHLPLKS